MKSRKQFVLIPAVLFLSLGTFLILTGCSHKSDITLDLTEENRADIPPDEPAGEEGSFCDETGDTSAEDAADQPLFVYVHGAVKTPGVFRLDPGARVYEAIAAAGGATAPLPANGLNQAAVLSDGQEIYLPTKEEQLSGAVFSSGTLPAEGGSTGGGSGGKETVNLNTASREELMRLNGIGESRAADIIAYREKNGAFRSIEEIKNVPGIKDGMYAKIKDQITV